jgi:adenosylhomocysteine nucleosidase
MKRIAIIAALPGELKPLVAGWARMEPEPLGAWPGVRLWRSRDGEFERIAGCGGIGLAAAERAFAAAEAGGPLNAVVSVGWAGALRDTFKAGQAYLLAAVLDSETGATYPTASQTGIGLVATSRRVAALAEKRLLATVHRADLVDMEAAAIARLAAARNIPFYCIKGVSDAVTDRLPDFNPFIGQNGQFKLLPFALHAALRPQGWPALLRLGRQSTLAARAIHLRLGEVLGKLT